MARSRRGRDEGSIYQRADGFWCASVSSGLTAKGKRRRHVAYGKTKQVAREKLQQMVKDAVAGQPADGDRLTVGDYLSRWLALVKPTVEPNTYAPYRRHVELHLTPHVGRVKLAKFMPLHVEGLYAALNQGGMSAGLQRKVGTTLTIAMNYAIRMKLLTHNRHPASASRRRRSAR